MVSDLIPIDFAHRLEVLVTTTIDSHPTTQHQQQQRNATKTWRKTRNAARSLWLPFLRLLLSPSVPELCANFSSTFLLGKVGTTEKKTRRRQEQHGREKVDQICSNLVVARKRFHGW